MRTFCIAVMLCALSACESIIELETPHGEHKIVAHGFFTPDSVWTVDVDLSLQTSGSPATLLSGDTRQNVVIVKDDTGGVDTLQYYRGEGYNYRSVRGMHPRPNVTYTLRVEMPGFVSSETLAPPVPVEASAQLPERTPVQNLVYSNDNGTSSLRFSIEDPPGANYYRIELFQVGPEDGRAIRNDSLSIPQAVEDVFNYRSVIFQSTDPSFRFHYGEVGDLEQREEIDFNFYGRAVFSDALFDGTSHGIEIAFEPYTYPGFKPQFSVILSTLSSDLFMYLHTLNRHENEAAGIGSDYASEVFPVPVYSNINNGYGIFAGYVSDTYRFDQDGNDWEE